MSLFALQDLNLHPPDVRWDTEQREQSREKYRSLRPNFHAIRGWDLGEIFLQCDRAVDHITPLETQLRIKEIIPSALWTKQKKWIKFLHKSFLEVLCT